MDHYGDIILSEVPTLEADLNDPLMVKGKNWARQLYWGSTRFNGDPFYVHPLYTAKVALAFRPGQPHEGVRALLHDTEENAHYLSEKIRARFAQAKSPDDLEKLEHLFNAELPLFAEFVNIRPDLIPPVRFMEHLADAIGRHAQNPRPVDMDALGPVLGNFGIHEKFRSFVATKIQQEFGYDDEWVVFMLTRASNEFQYNEAFIDPKEPLHLRRSAALIKCPDSYYNGNTLDFETRPDHAERVILRDMTLDPFLERIARPWLPGLYEPKHAVLQENYEELRRRVPDLPAFKVAHAQAEEACDRTLRDLTLYRQGYRRRPSLVAVNAL